MGGGVGGNLKFYILVWFGNFTIMMPKMDAYWLIGNSYINVTMSLQNNIKKLFVYSVSKKKLVKAENSTI